MFSKKKFYDKINSKIKSNNKFVINQCQKIKMLRHVDEINFCRKREH